jgi:cyclohexyl-isocyanide hydratase
MALQIGILVFPGVQQLDLTGPYEVFASLPEAKVHLIWKDRAPITSATGLVLGPTMTFSECPALDVICVPGGGGVNALLQDAGVLAFLRAGYGRAMHLVCTARRPGAAGLSRAARRRALVLRLRGVQRHPGPRPRGARRQLITAGG